MKEEVRRFLERKGVHSYLIELWERYQILFLYKKTNKKLWLVVKGDELFWVDMDELTSFYNRVVFRLFATLNLQITTKDFFQKLLKQNLIENEWRLVYEFEDWVLKVEEDVLVVNGVKTKHFKIENDEKLVEIGERFINNLTSDECEREVLELWLLWLFKNPNKKSQKILAIIGERGTGKTTFTIAISNALRRKFEVLDGQIISKITPKLLRSDFNDFLLSKLIIIEEAAVKSRDLVEKLKDFATMDFTTINQKFKPPKLIVNKSEFIFTANEFTLPIEATLKERRWIIVKTKPYNLRDVFSWEELGIVLSGKWLFPFLRKLEKKYEGVNILERMDELIFSLKHKRELILEAKTDERTIAAKTMRVIEKSIEIGLPYYVEEEVVRVRLEDLENFATALTNETTSLSNIQWRDLLRQIKKGFHSDVFKIENDEWLVVLREFWEYWFGRG